MLAKQMSLGPVGTYYQNNLVGDMMDKYWVQLMTEDIQGGTKYNLLSYSISTIQNIILTME